MVERGYKAISVREDIAVKIQQEAKEEGKVISVYLYELIEGRKSKKRGEEEGGKEGGRILNEAMEELYKEIEELRRELKGGIKGIVISEEEIKKIVKIMEPDLGMYIERGIERGIASLER